MTEVWNFVIVVIISNEQTILNHVPVAGNKEKQMLEYFRNEAKEKRQKQLAELDDRIFEKQRELKDIQYQVEVVQRDLRLKEEDFEKRKKDELAEIERMKKFANEDFQRELKKKDEQIEKIKEKAETKVENDAITLKLKYEKDLNEVREQANAEVADKMKKVHEDNYNKLSEALSKLHSEGNASTKFMTEIAQGLISSTSKDLNSHTSRLEYVHSKEDSKG